ncbi:MAG: ABC transporter ATP-binding protein [Anaerolineae bacterium]|nr:ABC transporter ATP-binding protein [Anaerolineae bacterium]
MISVKGLSVTLGKSQILKNVNLEVHAGEVVGLIGPNGAGKSTLIYALCGLCPVPTGCVKILEKDINQLSDNERARLIAVIPQTINIPPSFTGWEMVLLGRTPYINWLGQTSKQDTQKTREAMLRTNTLELAHRRLGELSGGEQQRLILARALAQSTPILLMDEPTAHLDIYYQMDLLEKIQRLVKEDRLAALVILHDPNLLARFCDQIAILFDGKLISKGAPQEVFKPEVLSEVYRIPFEVMTSTENLPIVIPSGNGKSQHHLS